MNSCKDYIEFIGGVDTPSTVEPRLILNKEEDRTKGMLKSISDRLKKIPKEFDLDDAKNILLNKIFKTVDDIQNQ